MNDEWNDCIRSVSLVTRLFPVVFFLIIPLVSLPLRSRFTRLEWNDKGRKHRDRHGNRGWAQTGFLRHSLRTESTFLGSHYSSSPAPPLLLILRRPRRGRMRRTNAEGTEAEAG